MAALAAVTEPDANVLPAGSAVKPLNRKKLSEAAFLAKPAYFIPVESY